MVLCKGLDQRALVEAFLRTFRRLLSITSSHRDLRSRKKRVMSGAINCIALTRMRRAAAERNKVAMLVKRGVGTEYWVHRLGRVLLGLSRQRKSISVRSTSAGTVDAHNLDWRISGCPPGRRRDIARNAVGDSSGV